MNIWCCTCGRDIEARLINGAEAYPHRKDLKELPFWKCDTCKNFVGCHHKSTKPTMPLGVISNKEVKAAKIHIHALIDPAWQNGKIKRGSLYARLADKLLDQEAAAETTPTDTGA